MWIYIWKEWTVQTFDFQNDWSLNWYNKSIGYWDCSIATGQWWMTSSSSTTQWSVYPPTSIYWWDLKKITIFGYKNWNWAFGLYSVTADKTIEYWRDTTKLIINGTTIENITLNWEITMEIIFEDNWHITVNLINWWNTYTYDMWAYASQYKWYWDDKDLGLMLWRWSNSNPVYVRKVVIETV